MIQKDDTKHAVILGGGPAGLACAYELAQKGIEVTVIERNEKVGGLCRTLEHENYLFDIGGHRFLSKSEEVNQFWDEILSDDFLHVSRKSRIIYDNKFFSYPLDARNALKELGWKEASRCVLSFLYAKFFIHDTQATFEEWMIKRFGRRLYEIFFKSYTEKVWGVPCSELSSDWADQRIQGLSLGAAVHRALIPSKGGRHKTLTREFLYPRLGPGLFYDTLTQKLKDLGVEFLLESDVQKIFYEGPEIREIMVSNGTDKAKHIECDFAFSSIPLPHLIKRMQPAVPSSILRASTRLKFRSFMVVCLVFNEEEIFDDQWIYVHTPEVRVGRVQNYKNWSREMVPENSKTSLGMEYFVTQGDALWSLNDDEMISFALREIEQLNLTDISKFEKGFVFRAANAYPVYNPGYRENVAEIKGFLSSFTNLQVLGRAGLFRYNNSDHAILTGFYGARNLLGAHYDLWNIDVDGCD